MDREWDRLDYIPSINRYSSTRPHDSMPDAVVGWDSGLGIIVDGLA